MFVIIVPSFFNHNYEGIIFFSLCSMNVIVILVANFSHVVILHFLRQLQEQEARRFFQQIISGVDYCHRHMVVHRYNYKD